MLSAKTAQRRPAGADSPILYLVIEIFMGGIYYDD